MYAPPSAENPPVDVVDSTWVRAPARTVAPIVADPANWSRWWPGLELAVTEDRGRQGLRWSVRGVERFPESRLAGTAEVWIELLGEGCVVHFFLRLDATRGPRLTPEHARALEQEYRRRTKRAFWALGDALDPGRAARLSSAAHPALRVAVEPAEPAASG